MTDTRQERADLCDLLLQLGPNRPTLCEGWSTRDLAAHLLLRERRPLAALGIVLPPVAGYTARVQERIAEGDFPDLVALLRQPPGWSPARLDRVDHAVNSLELFIHHEDVRRAQPDWQPRPLPAPLARALWERIRVVTRLRLRRFPGRLTVSAPGFGQLTAGKEGEEVTLTGDPGELTLFLTGRQRASRAELHGPQPLTDRLTRARLGL